MSRFTFPRTQFLAALLVLMLAPMASAQIEIGAGYSNLHLAGTDKNLQNVDGFGVDLRLGGPIIPLPVVDSLRLGIDLGWRRYNTDGTGTNPFSPDKSDLDLFNAELRAAWRQPLGPFFIEPYVSGGLLLGTYSSNNHFNLSNLDQTKVGWSVRPEIAVGAKIAIVTIGIEGSYRIGHLQTFSNGAGGNLNEWYAGAFAGISF